MTYLRCTAAAGLIALISPLYADVASLLPEDGMFNVYENNRRQHVPNDITEDFLLLSYSMILQESVAAEEQNRAYPSLRTSIAALAERAAKAGNSEAETSNRDFLAVLSHLLVGSEPDTRSNAVAAELARVRAAKEISKSPVLLQTIDYSQFRPRGYYTRSPELSRYFQAVRYAGTAAFYIKDSAATGVNAASADRLTRQAMLLTQWIQEIPDVSAWFKKQEERTSWLFGPSEDLPSQMLIDVAHRHLDASHAEWRRELLERARSEGHQPVIWSAAIDTSRLEPGVTAQDALTAWSLIPLSFTPDGAAQQQLVYDRVGRFLGKGTPLSLIFVHGVPVKGFPMASEIMALLGSGEAQAQLDASGDTKYEGYDKSRGEAQRQIDRPAGLPGEELSLLKWWFTAPGHDEVRLRTARGFWTLYRHAAVLYAKQSYTATGKGLAPEDTRNSAWLEPSKEFYERLQHLSSEVASRIEAPALGRFSEILGKCVEIAGAEQSGVKLSADKVAFLNGLDHDLLKLTGGPDLPVAVDVHTDLNSRQVLIEALDHPTTVKQGDSRGARFHPAEFKKPLTERLTDEQWQQELRRR